MAERGGDRGGFGRGFGCGRDDRGRGRRGGRREEEKKWVPVTKLGRLVKDGKITSLEQIYLYSLPVKEHHIIDTLFGGRLKDGVMKIMPVQKQTRAGQRTRFKDFVVVGDIDGHVGIGVKCAKEVATAIRGAIILAKLSVIPSSSLPRLSSWPPPIADSPCFRLLPLLRRLPLSSSFGGCSLPPPIFLTGGLQTNRASASSPLGAHRTLLLPFFCFRPWHLCLLDRFPSFNHQHSAPLLLT